VVVGRRAKQLAVALTCVTVLAAAVIPIVFEHALRGQLASLGFTNVHVAVAQIGVNRVVLEDVKIDDVQLGRVEIEPGLSLLWKDPQRIVIPDATATARAMAAVGAKASRRPTRSSTKSGRIELSISVRDPSAGGFTATATGTLVLGKDVRLDQGHLEIVAPAVRQSSLAGTGVSLSFDGSGTLSPFAIIGSGSVHADRVELGPIALAGARVPFTVDRQVLAFGGGSAALFGGTVTSHPFTIDDPRIVLDATGLRLGSITGAKSPVVATGLVDGQLAIDARESVRARGHLRARTAGTLRVRDPKWRAQLAAAGGAGASAITDALLDFRYDTLALERASTMTLSLAGKGANHQQPIELVVRVNGVQDAARWLLERP
jgi:hypothetical protein